jgi:hypothetical protein
MHVKQEIPIWASDWTFENQKNGIKFKISNIPTKCDSPSFALTNKWQVRRAIEYLKVSNTIKKNLKPISVKLRKQIGFGKYEKHEIYSPEKK